MSGQAQAATCEECFLPAAPYQTRKVKLCDFHAQAEALLRAFEGIAVRHHSLAVQLGRYAHSGTFGACPHGFCKDSRILIAAARPHAAAEGGTG